MTSEATASFVRFIKELQQNGATLELKRAPNGHTFANIEMPIGSPEGDRFYVESFLTTESAEHLATELDTTLVHELN